MLKLFYQHKFLFEELVKRDFRRKYKRTILGMVWSILNPLITLLILKIVFSTFFGRSIPHYTIYLFCGTLLYAYFQQATHSGMNSLVSNAAIFKKLNVPKYIFLLSSNVASLINFGLTMLIFFGFCLLDDLTFSWRYLLLIYPAGCLILFNLGIGFILSALFVFFRDIQYLYDIFSRLLMYMSAIFYSIEIIPVTYQKFFLANPMYIYITFYREIILEEKVPDPLMFVLAAFYALLALAAGAWIYKRFNRDFLYYV